MSEASEKLRAYLWAHAATDDRVIVDQSKYRGQDPAQYITFGDLRSLLAERMEMEERNRRMWILLGRAEDLLDSHLHSVEDPTCEICKWVKAVGDLTIVPLPPESAT